MLWIYRQSSAKSFKFCESETTILFSIYYLEYLSIKQNNSMLLPGVKEEGHPGFSYQNLSPRLRLANCSVMRQESVGPRIAPGRAYSEIAALHKSISSTCLQKRTNGIHCK